ncbi:hypothetical protein ACFLUU_08330 [Chloroflexota bacterium]
MCNFKRSTNSLFIYGESGAAFVLVLILLAIGSLLILPMLRISYSAQKFHQVVEINTLNAYAADSGVEYARYHIYNYPAEIQAQEIPIAVDGEDIVINGIDVHVYTEYSEAAAGYMITSIASKAGRSQTIECTIVIDVGLFGNVIACDGDLQITNCDFVNEAYPGESDVYTHGDIDITNSYIDGDVKASGTVSWASPSVITGEVIEGAEVLEFPEVDAELHKDKAQAGENYTGNYNTSDQDLGPIYIDGNLNIGNDDVVLTGTVYVTGDVSMGNSNVSGFGDIVAEGDISFTNYTYTVDNPVTLPLIMTIGVDKSITLGNDQALGTMAILYVPNGIIDLNNVDINGSVAATLVILNNAEISYPAELRGRADLPGAGLDTVTYLFK